MDAPPACTAAPRVVWQETGQAFDVRPGETVLCAARRHQVELPHDCQSGGCGTCRVRIVSGRVAYADGLPLGLSEEEAQAGYALACQAFAQEPLVLSAEPMPSGAAPTRMTATVDHLGLIGPDVVQLRLRLPPGHAANYRPGQYTNVQLDDGRHRSFSMASRPEGDTVDFHVRRIPGGAFTDRRLWSLRSGDALEIEFPHGQFRFHASDYRPLVMVATGTGLAPIKAMIESLMDDPDCPPVSLYWGARQPADLYLHDEILRWAPRLYDFRYVPVLSRADAAWTGRRGYVQDAVIADLPDLSEHAIYLCGSPAMIDGAKALFVRHGASVDHLYSDAFTFQPA